MWGPTLIWNSRVFEQFQSNQLSNDKNSIWCENVVFSACVCCRHSLALLVLLQSIFSLVKIQSCQSRPRVTIYWKIAITSLPSTACGARGDAMPARRTLIQVSSKTCETPLPLSSCKDMTPYGSVWLKIILHSNQLYINFSSYGVI